MEIGVTHAGGLEFDQCLAVAGLRQGELFDL
jgi:hypothetical protein